MNSTRIIGTYLSVLIIAFSCNKPKPESPQIQANNTEVPTPLGITRYVGSSAFNGDLNRSLKNDTVWIKKITDSLFEVWTSYNMKNRGREIFTRVKIDQGTSVKFECRYLTNSPIINDLYYFLPDSDLFLGYHDRIDNPYFNPLHDCGDQRYTENYLNFIGTRDTAY